MSSHGAQHHEELVPASAMSERRQTKLALMHAFVLEISLLHDLQQVIDRSLDCCLELMESKAGFIDLLNEGRTHRVMVGFKGVDVTPEFLASHRAIPIQPSVAGVVVMEGRIKRSNRVPSDPDSSGWPQGHPPIRSFLGAPLLVRDMVIGMVAVADRPGGYREPHVRLLGSLADHVAVAVENALLYEHQRQMITDLDDRQAELNATSVRDAEDARRRAVDQLMTAQEEERRRIAEDIHADSLQVLDAAILRLELLSRRTTEPGLQSQIAEVKGTVAEAENRLRHLVFELHPPAIDAPDGLRWALQDHLERICEGKGIRWELQMQPAENLPIQIRLTVFRIAQEAIANVVKHAQASVIRIGAQMKDDGILVSIDDDGDGFSVGAGLSPPGHFGLTEMRGRAELAGGWLVMRSAAGQGTQVEYWIPRG